LQHATTHCCISRILAKHRQAIQACEVKKECYEVLHTSDAGAAVADGATAEAPSPCNTQTRCQTVSYMGICIITKSLVKADVQALRHACSLKNAAHLGRLTGRVHGLGWRRGLRGIWLCGRQAAREQRGQRLAQAPLLRCGMRREHTHQCQQRAHAQRQPRPQLRHWQPVRSFHAG